MDKEKLKARALLIDFDGTLVDSTDALKEAGNNALSKVGCATSCGNIGLEIARCLQLNQSAWALDNFLDKANVDESLREDLLRLFLESFYKIAPCKTKLIQNVDKTLRELAKFFSLALVTRRTISREELIKELERLSLGHHFKIVVTSQEVRRPSPFPDAFLKAAERLEIPIQSCVVVSDSGIDIQAGKAAGAKTVAVLSGLFNEEELLIERPDLLIENLNHLLTHLRGI